MRVFLIYIRDEDFYNVLPERLGNSQPGGKFKVMAFPPLGIQTLAPVLRQHGHEVLLFDTCHPQMKDIHIAQAALNEKPDVIALSFLSTTTYLLVKNMARQLKIIMPDIPIIVGGGIISPKTAREIIDAGADVIVTGNLVEGKGDVARQLEKIIKALGR